MRALAIAVWIGALPGWFPLWLRTAGENARIDFLVVTDQAPPDGLPGNVRFSPASLASLRELWSNRLGLNVCLEQPYKLCDFKPLYWMLADELDAYDYWGFCDLDVIWGDLSRFVAKVLGRYDAILAEGHFRLFRNNEALRSLHRHPDNPIDWREALTRPQIFGFDEHPGINRALAAGQFVWFRNSGLVADLDPGFRQLRLLPMFPNYRSQAFSWRQGRVVRDFLDGGRLKQDEFIYAHIQKRKLTVSAGCLEAAAFAIDPQGFVPLGGINAAELPRRNPWHLPDLREARILLREWRRSWAGRPSTYLHADPLPAGAD